MEWINNVLDLQKIYWYLAIPFTVLFTIQLISTLLGLGGEDGADGIDASDSFEEGVGDEGSSDGGSAFQLFTTRNFIIFFTVFGWSGIAFSNMGVGLY